MKSGFENGGRVPVTDPEDGESGEKTIECEFPMSDEERQLIEKMVAARLFEAQLEVLLKFCFLIKDDKFPKRTVYQLMYAAGMGAAIGGSSASVARQFGVSRQAFEQEGARKLESLEMRKAPLEKRPEASEQYKASNFRRQKGEGRKEK